VIAIAAAWFAIERYVRGPAAEITRRARRAVESDPGLAPLPAMDGRFSELARAVGELAGKLASAEHAARQEAAMRERAEAALRASEERYAMANPVRQRGALGMGPEDRRGLLRTQLESLARL
jgi:hypothetical protein